MGVLPPGRVTLQSQNIPFLNNLITSYTGGNVFIAEIFFVKTSPVYSVTFGGPIGDMLDPLTGEQVTPRIFGELSLVIIDPVRFIVGYHGQAAGGDNDQTLNWVKGLFLNGVRTTLGELCEVEGKSVLQSMSLRQKLAAKFVASCPDLADIGIKILNMGDYQINFSDEDKQRLQEANAEIARAQRAVKVQQIGVAGAAAQAQAKQFELDQKYQQDARYVQNLAGNYQNYAGGQAMIGAGQGMAAHGVGDSGLAGAGVQMAMGAAMAGAMVGGQQRPPQAGAAPNFPVGQPAAGGVPVTCSKCNAVQPAGKFCSECGNPLASMKKFCTGCGGEVAAAAKFCANCGTSAVAG
jgi:membrane protease subunit (stomatin/prohibitin family)